MELPRFTIVISVVRDSMKFKTANILLLRHIYLNEAAELSSYISPLQC